MTIFTTSVILCSTIFILFYVTLFSRNKNIINYKKKDHLQRLISQNDFEYLLIDIRQNEAYLKSHIPTPVNITLQILLSTLPVENMFLTIIVYGDSKREAGIASEYLSRNGYFNVTCFGSLSLWKGNLVRNDYIGDKDIEYSKKGRHRFPV
ncbi:MAG: rhodanese-like domain-containing protein [Spirochaetaceae bacterium]|jgi:rhodanese-related sulfurtransferase|nr:rhodanese-like domain-containing protein [Spirochaetaceae bacterium]